MKAKAIAALLLLCLLAAGCAGCASQIQAVNLMEGITAAPGTGKPADDRFLGAQADLSAKLKRQGIGMQFIHRGNDPKKAVQGVTFTKDGLTFKGSQVDRKFSYAGLSKMIRERVETLAREAADEEIKYMRERRREQERNTTPKPRKAPAGGLLV